MIKRTVFPNATLSNTSGKRSNLSPMIFIIKTSFIRSLNNLLLLNNQPFQVISSILHINTVCINFVLWQEVWGFSTFCIVISILQLRVFVGGNIAISPLKCSIPFGVFRTNSTRLSYLSAHYLFKKVRISS